MRVLVITQMYPPHHLGGYELACQDVVERWAAEGHQVEVLTTTFRTNDAMEAGDEDPTTRVRRELSFYWDEHRIVRPGFRQTVRMERRNQDALAKALQELRPEVVSVWHMGAMSLGLLQTVVDLHLPMVLVVADQWLVYGQGVDAWTGRFARRRRLGRVARSLTRLPTSWDPNPEIMATCFASEWLRGKTLERSPWRLGHTTVSYLGIDPRRFAAPERVEEQWTWRLLCTGRVEERKGVHVAVEALGKLPEATLTIVGPPDDAYLSRIRRRAEELRVADRIEVTGAVPRRELPDRYRSADAYLFPVLWEEPFGLVPLEAMACGTPVIATGTGGSAEFLVDETNALLVPRGDPHALAEAVRRLASDPRLRASLVSAGHMTVANAGVDRLATVLREWHEAASVLFRDGVPADREPISAGVAPSASGPGPDA